CKGPTSFTGNKILRSEAFQSVDSLACLSSIWNITAKSCDCSLYMSPVFLLYGALYIYIYIFFLGASS
uniref:Uncharacterized protein n=1 Tax=Echeneis naucrates TaxID=173247 RepID=A0A665WSJ2_ECHNA